MGLTTEQQILKQKWNNQAKQFSEDVNRVRNEILLFINNIVAKNHQFIIRKAGFYTLIEYNSGTENHVIISIQPTVSIPEDFKKNSEPVFMVFFSIEGTGSKKEYHENFTVSANEYNRKDLDTVKKKMLIKIRQYAI